MLNGRTHPGEDLLLRFSDGELRAREAARIASHLEACWECRTRLEDLKRTIREYVHYRAEVLLPGLPPPPGPWKGLEGEFARIRMEETGRGGRVWLRRPPVWALAGATAVLAMAAIKVVTGWQAPRETQSIREQPVAIRDKGSELPAPAAKSSDHLTAQLHPPVQPSVASQTAPALGPEDELKVVAALHRAGADLGDPVEVQRKPDQIVVTAIGLDPHRLETIRGALAGMSRVSVEVPTEIPAHVNENSSVEKDAGAAAAPAKFQQVSDAVLEASEAMMARAFALRRLAERFPPDLEMQLSPEGQQQLAAIRDQHVAAFVEQIGRIDRALGPILGSLGHNIRAPGPSGARDQTWQMLTQQLFPLAARTDRLLANVFAAPKSDPGGDASLDELAAGIGELERGAAAFSVTKKGAR